MPRKRRRKKRNTYPVTVRDRAPPVEHTRHPPTKTEPTLTPGLQSWIQTCTRGLLYIAACVPVALAAWALVSLLLQIAAAVLALLTHLAWIGLGLIILGAICSLLNKPR